MKLLILEERNVGIVLFPLHLIFENRPPRGSDNGEDADSSTHGSS